MKNDKISEILGIRSPEEIENSSEELKDLVKVSDNKVKPIEKLEDQLPAIPAENNENIDDMELARQNIKNIIEMGDDAVKEMVEIAKQSESPRAFEVVSTLMKTLLDANKDFVDISTKKKYASEEESSPKQDVNVTNNNLIVSTADLLKMLKGDDDK